MDSILYLHLKKKIQTQPGQQVSLRDIGQFAGSESCKELLDLPIYQATLKNGNFTVISALEVIRCIHEQNPQLDVRNIGPAQVIIETKMPNRIPKAFLVFFVWILLFTGSGLAIMNFHTDVSMRKVHQRIYYLVTGQHSLQPLILQIPYSIGIGLGMILFFNHIFRRRFNEEPSPMELEMFQYQETMDQYIIEHEKKKVENSRDGSFP